MIGPVSAYLDLFSGAATRKAYHIGIARFLTFLDGHPCRSAAPVPHSDEVLAAMDARAEAYFREVNADARAPATDMVHFLAAMQRDFAPSTVAVSRSAVLGFLEENGIELSRQDERRIKKRVPRIRNVAEEETLTRDALQAILPLLSIRDRAVLLVLLASGGRIGEVLQLRLQDVDLEAAPVRVTFRAATTKTGVRRIAFLTDEAAEAVRVWLGGRSDYLRTAARRNVGLTSAGRSRPKAYDDERLFPFKRSSFDLAWGRALERAGLFRRCEVTGRLTLHPHSLRKCFRSWLGAAAGPDIAEVLMGHEGYLGTYRRYTEEDLAEAYVKHSHVLCVASGSGELARQVADLQEKNDTLEAELRDIRLDLYEVREWREWRAKTRAASTSTESKP
ncbi:MAG: tyrosine-type recombinase/integrase [Methanospirillum sp.]